MFIQRTPQTSSSLTKVSWNVGGIHQNMLEGNLRANSEKPQAYRHFFPALSIFSNYSSPLLLSILSPYLEFVHVKLSPSCKLKFCFGSHGWVRKKITKFQGSTGKRASSTLQIWFTVVNKGYFLQFGLREWLNLNFSLLLKRNSNQGIMSQVETYPWERKHLLSYRCHQ